MSRRVVVLPEAEEELTATAQYYEEQRAGLGGAFLDAIDEALARASENPKARVSWMMDGRYGRSIVPRFLHLVFFEEREDVIEVVAVTHASRLPGHRVANRRRDEGATHEFRLGRLVWRFDASGGDGAELKSFAELGPDQRTSLLCLADLLPGELPAIGLHRSGDDWLLLTSARLVWQAGAERRAISLFDIADATLDIRTVHAAGSKEVADRLTVTTRAGWSFPLRLEAGRALSGMWNVLRMVSKWAQ